MIKIELEKFEKNIDYTFKNKQLLKTALTHTSYANEKNIESNEKLEFLGDAILEFVTSEYLYEKYINLKEGEMTKVRASVVCEESLYKIAMKHNFTDFLYLGKGELASGNKIRVAILADSVEAVIAAMFLDSDMQSVKKFIITNLKEEIEVASKNVGMKDHKTILQEKLQAHKGIHIEYKIVDEKGPDHDKSFTAAVFLNGKILGSGTGRSKKIAEMEAAKAAIENKKV